MDRNHGSGAGRRRRFRLCRSRRLVDAHGLWRLCSVARPWVSGRHGPRAAAACSAARLRVSGRHGSRTAAACSVARLRVPGRHGSPSPPGGGRGLGSRSLSRRRSPASAPGDARTLGRGFEPLPPVGAGGCGSEPLTRPTDAAASEGRPRALTRLAVMASFRYHVGPPQASRTPGRPLRLYLPEFWWGEW